MHKGLKRAPTAQNWAVAAGKEARHTRVENLLTVIEQKKAECSRRDKKRHQSVRQRKLGGPLTIEKDNSVLVSPYSSRIMPEDRFPSVSEDLPIRQWSRWLNAQKLRNPTVEGSVLREEAASALVRLSLRR